MYTLKNKIKILLGSVLLFTSLFAASPATQNNALTDKQLHAVMGIITNFILSDVPRHMTIISPTNVTVEENQTSAIDIRIKDAIGAVSYSISGIDAAYFNIDTSTGHITFINAPDHESKQSYIFNVTVTDSQGNTATATVTVNIIPQVPTGVNISAVSGNTASYNAIAEFTVSLTRKPTSDVLIPVSSSNESEGIPNVSTLTFTAINWNQPQTVVVKGRNTHVVDGVQDYKIILAPAQSTDAHYNGFDPDDVVMRGIFLELSEPTDSLNLISGLETTIGSNVSYTGNESLSFSLEEKPDGMTINLNTGLINWTPPESAEGHSFPVKVKVTDGILFTNVSFDVIVAETASLQTDDNGSVISVISDFGNLNGFKFRFTGDSPNLPEIKSLEGSSIIGAPVNINRLSGYFYADENNEGDIDILMPISILPHLNDAGRLVVYHLSEDHGWGSSAYHLRVEEIENTSYIVISIGSLKGVMFIGLMPEATGNTRHQRSQNLLRRQVVNPLGLSISDIHCSPEPLDAPLVSTFARQICTIDDINNTTFTVLGFGNANGRVNMWNPATSIEEMMVWVGQSRHEFDNLGIGTVERDLVITLDGANGDYGYVDSNNPIERGGTLHLSDGNTSVNRMKASVAHEYFHHAQVKTILSGVGRNLLAPNTTAESHGRRWISEGTAMWFEDYLYDDLNDYSTYLVNPLPRILEDGLTSFSQRYNVDMIWKLFSQKCTSFETNINDIFYANFTNNLTRIDNVERVLSNSDCNFGNHLGTEKKSSLEAALLYYQYATLYKNQGSASDTSGGDISLLDSNERSADFKFLKTSYGFSQSWLDRMADWLNLDDYVEYKLQAKNSIPPAGAFSFYVKPVSGDLPEDKIAVLNFEGNKDFIISIVSPNEDFENGSNTIGSDNDKHKWFKYSENSNFIYEFSGKVPKLFVTLVNPSTTDTVSNVKVTFEITDKVNHEINITSHSDGDHVNNRVVSMTGTVPINDIEGGIDTIRVTNNGATTITSVNADGSFEVGVVVAMGDNIMKFQGFKGTQSVTKIKQLKLIGVENSAGGRNALIPSRVAVVLRWKTNGTDIDLYSTDKNDGTIWYSNMSVAPGILDYDNTSGYGPEVISYRETDDALYVDGRFDIDVHFYAGSTATAYSLDVILNEIDSARVKARHYESKVSLPSGDSSQNGPTGSGTSRFNDVLSISCNAQRICSISAVDDNKLSSTSVAIQQSIALGAEQRNNHLIDKRQKIFGTAYEQCMSEYNKSLEKIGAIDWYCDKKTGQRKNY